MSFYIDSSGLRVLSQNLGKVAGSAVKDVDAVLKKGAQNIKEELAADVRGSTHFVGKKGPGLESSMSYDSDYRIGQPAYEIGPDKSRRGGALGNIYYFGTSRGGGSGDLEKPLRTEGPRLEKSLADLADQFGSQL
ncbi:hypothetical protein [Arthrobacter roseus]|uniref:hypothetical protein n=1 Tax=Arthrobacter roseus TaxID=136274 RepID=UPI00196536D5|nr:hypothetical protein [Arthrobacter roseus]MBM7847463.1 hypothetical protein [Arthrobacter roseus]